MRDGPYLFLEPTIDGVTIARWGPKSPLLVDADTSPAIIEITHSMMLHITPQAQKTKDQRIVSFLSSVLVSIRERLGSHFQRERGCGRCSVRERQTRREIAECVGAMVEAGA